ncbi:MAG: co-chaperone GroES [Lentisphaeria bacterium]
MTATATASTSWCKRLTPQGDNLLVERADSAKRTAGGIWIAPAHERKAVKGRVLAVGPGLRLDDGSRTPIGYLKPGMELLYAKYPGGQDQAQSVSKRPDIDDDVILVRERDVLAYRGRDGWDAASKAIWFPSRNRLLVRRLADPDYQGKGLILRTNYLDAKYASLPSHAREYVDCEHEYWRGRILALSPAGYYHEPNRRNALGPMHQTKCIEIPVRTALDWDAQPGDELVLSRYAGSHLPDLEHLVDRAGGEQVCCPHYREIEARWTGGEATMSLETRVSVGISAGEAEAVEESDAEADR